MKKFKFEKKVIDVLLNTIKDNQEYLTQPENLPQLAKLGYIYEMLWYSGRICWGHNGVLGKSNDCEDNPKYKIEMCNPTNDDIDNLIYGAWSLHVSNDMVIPNYEELKNLIFNGKELSEEAKMNIKPNKTFDEWVDICMTGKYSSIFPTIKSVADHLLFTNGNGYAYKDGYIIDREDSSMYGDWENSIFSDEIKKVIENIFSMKEVEDSINAAHSHITAIYEKEAKKKLLKDISIFGMSYEDFSKTDKFKKVLGKSKPKYEEYYPICEYALITKFDENTHISYIQAGLDSCHDILAHSDVEKEKNINFAKEFIEKFEENKNEVDKEQILNNARDAFRPIGYIGFGNWNF